MQTGLKVVILAAIMFNDSFGTGVCNQWLISSEQLRINPLHKITEGFLKIYFRFRLIRSGI